MNCSSCNQPIQPGQMSCPACNTPTTANPYAAGTAQQLPPQSVGNPDSDGTGGVIPYKNPKALIAYYLGILSGIPLLGLPVGIVAFVLGIMGLRDRKRNPAIKGSVHAWIGIGCGGIFTLLWGGIAVAAITAAIFG